MNLKYTLRGFLPEQDPVWRFEHFPDLEPLNELGASLPHRLEDPDSREFASRIAVPLWPTDQVSPQTLPELRLYYVRLGFLASGYINQVSQPAAHVLPANLAIPLARACRLLGRPPILSYDGYALYNWRRVDPAGPVALGNIDTIQNFVKLDDERWFILVHVEIEAIAARIIAAINRAKGAIDLGDRAHLDQCLAEIAAAIAKQTTVLRRIPEKMRADLYFRTFRPYIRFFEKVTYEGVDARPMNFRGETGAQSSIMPALVAFLRIRHQRSVLTDHLNEMRRFMPADDRELLNEIRNIPSPRRLASPTSYNAVLDQIACFREVHLGWADQYIHQHVSDPRGTGGTPYMTWLKQLIDETRSARLPQPTRTTVKS